MEALIFYIFAGLLVASSAAIFMSRDIVRSAMWLLGALGAVAGLLLLLAANFLAAVQLILYVGGVLVLIVFGVMLTTKSPGARLDPPRRERLAAAGVGLLLLGGLFASLRGSAFVVGEVSPPAAAASVGRIGEELLTRYWLPFQLVSILLLAVMIGAAVLARPLKREKAC